MGGKLEAARSEFQKMLNMGIIREAWSSPLHVVPKPNCAWHLYRDYHKLNLATVDDRYPFPHIQSFTIATAGARVFTSIDLIRGYHQIPMAPEDVPKTTFVTPLRVFEFLRMPRIEELRAGILTFNGWCPAGFFCLSLCLPGQHPGGKPVCGPTCP